MLNCLKRFKALFKSLSTCTAVSSEECKKILTRAFSETRSSCQKYGCKLFNNLSRKLEEFFQTVSVNTSDFVYAYLNKNIEEFDILDDYGIPNIPPRFLKAFFEEELDDEKKNMVYIVKNKENSLTTLNEALKDLFNNQEKASFDRERRIKDRNNKSTLNGFIVDDENIEYYDDIDEEENTPVIRVSETKSFKINQIVAILYQLDDGTNEISLSIIRSLRVLNGKKFQIAQSVPSTDGKARIIVQHLQEYSQQKFRLDFFSRFLVIGNIFGVFTANWIEKEKVYSLDSNQYKELEKICRKQNAILF